MVGGLKFNQMKLPKSFKPEKNLDEKTNSLANQKFRHEKVSELVKISKEEFNHHKYNFMGHPDRYKSCLELAQKLDYNKFDLQEMVLHLSPHDFVSQLHLGVYVSALVNNIMEEDTAIDLKLPTSIDCLGTFLEQGYLTLEGNVGMFLGHTMKGGSIDVIGNVGDYLGYCMAGGNILVKGNVGNWAGAYKEEGQIIIHGDMGELHPSYNEQGIFLMPEIKS